MPVGEIVALLGAVGALGGGLGVWIHKTWGSYQERKEAERLERAEKAEADRIAREAELAREQAQAEEERAARSQVIETYRTELNRLTLRVEALETRVATLTAELHLSDKENERLRTELMAKETALSAAISERDATAEKLAKLQAAAKRKRPATKKKAKV